MRTGYICPLDSHLWFHIISPMTHVVYLVPFFIYLAGYKHVSARPSELDTMTITALETIVSSSGKKLPKFPMIDISRIWNK